jgi:hypothetical protein
MAWSCVQTKTASSAVTGTAVSCTFDAAPTPGSFLIAVIMHSGVAAQTLVSSYGDYRVAVGDINIVYHFYKIADEGESATFTMTFPAAASWAVMIKEYDVDGTGVENDAVNVDASQASGVSTYTLNNPGLEGNGDLCVSCFAQQQATTRDVTSYAAGWTEAADIAPASTPAIRLHVADRVLSTPTDPVNQTWTLSGTTTAVPSKMNQALIAVEDPARRTRFQQQAAAGRW